MNIEPYLPVLTAAFTLLNTLVLVWSHREVRKVRSKVNGMYLQTLADAEQRGRVEASLQGMVRPAAPGAKSVLSRSGWRVLRVGPFEAWLAGPLTYRQR